MRYAEQRWNDLAMLLDSVAAPGRTVADIVDTLERAAGGPSNEGRAVPGEVTALRRFARVHRAVVRHDRAADAELVRAVDTAIDRLSGRDAATRSRASGASDRRELAVSS